MVKINWINQNPGAAAGDGGYWISSENRFETEPLPMGRTTPQAYYLHDRMTKKRSMHDTVRECKSYALRIVSNEHSR